MSDVVTGLVGTHLFELHAPATKGTLILAGKGVADQSLRADLNRLDLLEELGRQYLREVLLLFLPLLGLDLHRSLRFLVRHVALGIGGHRSGRF